MSPRRIQRQRTKGWRMPDGATYVGRPTRWGNPFKVGALYRDPGPYRSPATPQAGGPACIGSYPSRDLVGEPYQYEVAPIRDRRHAVELFAAYVRFYDDDWSPDLIREPLAGRDLTCWCPLDQPCHADVLLEIANPEEAP